MPKETNSVEAKPFAHYKAYEAPVPLELPVVEEPVVVEEVVVVDEPVEELN